MRIRKPLFEKYNRAEASKTLNALLAIQKEIGSRNYKVSIQAEMFDSYTVYLEGKIPAPRTREKVIRWMVEFTTVEGQHDRIDTYNEPIIVHINGKEVYTPDNAAFEDLPKFADYNIEHCLCDKTYIRDERIIDMIDEYAEQIEDEDY